ncbi:MAG: type IV pilus twitching motility protein PilT [Eubacteriales bacterium]|nr:type IV pilus twitching motility protein PilT [Eubacteriales bacterium]
MELKVEAILKEALALGASDLFLIAHRPISFKIDGEVYSQGDKLLTGQDTAALLQSIYSLCQRDMAPLLEKGDDDFSFSLPGLGRFRVNAYRQRNSLAAVIRMVMFTLPDPATLGIPDSVISLSGQSKGLVLVTGMAGSGKSTTLACIVDAINRARSGHIITLEDPIEFIHRHNKSIVSQREVFADTQSYSVALRAALRQSPDVILLGEMRDFETISIAMTAAETGQLVLSSLHTVGAVNTIDRIVDVFPPNQQRQIRIQLSMVLQAVISQQLLPAVGGGRVPAFEIMLTTPAIRNLIREEKAHQIDSILYSSQNLGMMTMDGSILQLVKEGRITRETALIYASNPEELARRLN